MTQHKKHIKIDFMDFWRDFNKTDNYFYNLLKDHYEIEICPDPDIIFYSNFNNKFKKYKCKKVYFTGECRRPDFRECDYAFTFDYVEDKRNYRLPLYAIYDDPQKLIKPADFDPLEIIKQKTKFCCFIISNPDSPTRNNFFEKLSKYKKVDSGGKVFNNINYVVQNKWEFIKDYKFNIAFENRTYPGYTTEKIFEPMLFNTTPIYWGNELIYNDFNPKSFINYNDFEDEDALIEKIISIDRDDQLLAEILKEPYFTNNQLNEFVKKENVLKQMEYIINDETTPVSCRNKWFWI